MSFVFKVEDGWFSPFQAGGSHLLQQIRLLCFLLYWSCRKLYPYENDYKNKNVAMSCTLNYILPASSKTDQNVKHLISIKYVIWHRSNEHISCLLTVCTTQDEDKNAINLKFIVSLAKMLADYFLPTLWHNNIFILFFFFFLECWCLPSEFGKSSWVIYSVFTTPRGGSWCEYNYCW